MTDVSSFVLTTDMSPSDRSAALSLLVAQFKDDKGMFALFGNKDRSVDEADLRVWFDALLSLLQTPGSLAIAKASDDVAGVIVRTIKNNPPGTWRYASWIWRVSMSLGLRVVLATARHDQVRSKHVPGDATSLVEFVCVSPKYRGMGIAKSLLNEAPGPTDFLARQWLETTKPQNVQIFESCDFKEIARYEDEGVLNICMTNP